jgi:DNA-binding XRE family transcriptional regulator
MPPKIKTTNQLQRNVYNKISPKILSPDADSNFFVNEAQESGKIILKLRLLNKLTIENMCHKLGITKETYMKLEKGEKIPSKEISQSLISIFNLKIENKLQTQ